MITITKAEATSLATYVAGIIAPLIIKYFGFNIDMTIMTSIIMFIIIFVSEHNPRLKYVDDELLANNTEEDDDGGC